MWTIRKIDGNKSFYEFAENEIAYMTEMKAPAETLRTFSSLISKLKQYEGSLYFNDITLEFLKKYHSFMVNDLNNHENTCSKLFRFMRNMINRAISQNIIKENVFDRFQIKSLPGKREFLSEDELKILEDLNIKGTGTRYLNNVLKYFLFACYTGLRYQDLKKLRFSDLKKGNIDDSEVFFIRITMHKTREEVSVPLIPKAFALVGEPGFQNQKVFRVSVNQLTNRHLKEIITKAKIQKNITFHCARHTFAVHCLELEMPIEVVSALLGHTNLKTTEIYTKILDRRKLYHLSKWK
ncbi:MAG: site-specific integrase [Bacteroidota bacterium]